MKLFSILWALCSSCLLFTSCGDKKEQATKELETSGYQATPVDFLRAAENGDVRVLELFAKQGMDLSTKDDYGWTALHIAARAKRQESVAFLLDAGLDIETPGLDGVTPMMLAAREGNSSMVRYLLKQGAKAELKDDKNRSALILAIDGGHTACVEEIAPYSRNQLDTGLLYAAAQGKHQVIETLTSFGASVYVRHEGGMTPLMLAAEKGYTKTVDVLLENGANRYAVNEHGWTAAQVASASNQEAIANLLNQTPDSSELAINEAPEEDGVEWTAPIIAATDMPAWTTTPPRIPRLTILQKQVFPKIKKTPFPSPLLVIQPTPRLPLTRPPRSPRLLDPRQPPHQNFSHLFQVKPSPARGPPRISWPATLRCLITRKSHCPSWLRKRTKLNLAVARPRSACSTASKKKSQLRRATPFLKLVLK